MLDSPITLAWIDYTAIAIILVFVVLGFFRGLLWQVSRLASLLVSFWLSGMYAGELAVFVEDKLQWFEGDIALYASYFAIFIGCLILLSLVTILLDKLLRRLDLKYYDYLGGGVLGMVTGTALVIVALGAALAFSPRNGNFFRTVNASETARWSRVLVERLDPWLPERLRELYLQLPKQAASSEEQKSPAKPKSPGEGR
ncbi:MAG: hypothetical protein CSA62_12215 [Planctomycetota bacterium]|nr:MAG: hypothetical protein CSA62_12215 [Planctomycetota bacterium]